MEAERGISQRDNCETHPRDHWNSLKMRYIKGSAFGANTEAYDQAAVSGTATYVGDEHGIIVAITVVNNCTENKMAQVTGLLFQLLQC